MKISLSAGLRTEMATEAAKALDHAATEIFEREDDERYWLRDLAGQLRSQEGRPALTLTAKEPRMFAAAVTALTWIAAEVFEATDPQRPLLRHCADQISSALAAAPTP